MLRMQVGFDGTTLFNFQELTSGLFVFGSKGGNDCCLFLCGFIVASYFFVC